MVFATKGQANPLLRGSFSFFDSSADGQAGKLAAESKEEPDDQSEVTETRLDDADGLPRYTRFCHGFDMYRKSLSLAQKEAEETTALEEREDYLSSDDTESARSRMSRSRVSFDESQNKTFAVPSRKEAAKAKRKKQKKNRSEKRMAQKNLTEEEMQTTKVEPAVEEQKPEPAAEECTPEPAVEESTPEPVAEENDVEPLTEEEIAGPVLEEKTPEPVMQAEQVEVEAENVEPKLEAEYVELVAEAKSAEPETKEEETQVTEPTVEVQIAEPDVKEEVQETLEAEVVAVKVEPETEENKAEPAVETTTVEEVEVPQVAPTLEVKKVLPELKIDTQEELEAATVGSTTEWPVTAETPEPDEKSQELKIDTQEELEDATSGSTTEWSVTAETPEPDEKSQESIIEVTEDDDCMSVEVSYKSSSSQASEEKKSVSPPSSLLDAVKKVQEPDKRETIAGIKKKAHAMSYQKRIHSDEISITDQSFVNETTLAYRRRAMGLKERKKAAEIERKTKAEERKLEALQYEEKMKATMEIKRREAAQMLLLAHSESVSGEDDDESRGNFSLDSATESFFDGAAMAVYNKVTLDIGKAKQTAVVPATPTLEARSMSSPSAKRGIMSKSPKKKGTSSSLVVKPVAMESEVFVAETEKPKKWSRWIKKRLGVRS
jgi:hypothetical protein